MQLFHLSILFFVLPFDLTFCERSRSIANEAAAGKRCEATAGYLEGKK
jgi:hypothetical protein